MYYCAKMSEFVVLYEWVNKKLHHRALSMQRVQLASSRCAHVWWVK